MPLRKKTPSGTVDAGYDGSHILTPPRPPMKHHWNHWLQSTSPISSDQAIQPQASSLPHSWTFSNEPPSTYYSMSSMRHPSSVGYSDRNKPPVLVNDYDIRAFCPPAAPNNDTFLLDQTRWHTGTTLQDDRSHDHTCYSGSGHVGGFQVTHRSPTDHSLHHHPVCFGSHDLLTNGNQIHNDSQWPLQSSAGSSVLLSAQSTSFNGQSHFCEKVLQCSHYSYIDLLSYLETNSETQSTKPSSDAFKIQKLSAYTTPPRFWGTEKIAGKHLTGSHLLSPNELAVISTLCNKLDTLDSSCLTYDETCHGQTTTGCDINFAQELLRAGSASTMSMSTSTYNVPEEPPPIVNALASLRVLSNLCEQSEWNWIDGMLIGGCLQYALESHVEAITHMGAALYCLGRQDEAESNWLYAVKLRPNHLDATEYLVDHLYKNRDEDAVGLVSHIQSSIYHATKGFTTSKDSMKMAPNSHNWKYSAVSADLRIASGAQGAHDEEDSSGFGSSGYLLPGVDNGRILALVHAKGTMLYGLNEIERAFEAFQEAVLISVGRQVGSIQELIDRIQHAFAPQSECQNTVRLPPLLLTPERARHTARLFFGDHGELPGLMHLRNGRSKSAAVHITSNALLSLAKISQDALSNGTADSCLFHGASQVSDTLILYYLSLSLQESPSTANNVGILLAGTSQSIATTSTTGSLKFLPQPSIPGITPGSSLALALDYYNYGLQLDPNHVHLHTNLGSLLKDVGQLDLAIQMYERAVLCDGLFDIALTNLANAVKDKGRINEAIIYYQRAVNVNPRFAEAVCGLYIALSSVCNWYGRGGARLKSGQYDRWHVGNDGGLTDVRISGCSSGLTKRVVDIAVKQLKDASYWGLGMLQEPAIHSLTSQLQCLCKSSSFEFDAALRRWAGQPWEGSRLVRLMDRATRIIQRNWMQSVFGFHDRQRVQAICYATTPSDGSVHRQQIETEAPVFRNVSNWPPDKLVDQINRDNIHILVNLNGYTRGARNEIFAARPAPVQMSFMGFAGTLGAEWCDYLLADRTTVPLSTLRPWRSNVSLEDVFCDDNEEYDGDWMYSENIIFCRETFFCCDHAQSCASGGINTSWTEVERQRWEMRKYLFPGMEDDIVILGNFNQLYKIDPTTFRSWLRILSRVPRAILWLLRFPESGESNLRATARQWAGSEVASRIIFTDVAPKDQHIARACVCDLFLDTPECNAHTTAADVLWSSTPLLTFPRYPYKMCSRMAASILQGALPHSIEGQQVAAELIAETEEEYEQRAITLANGLTYALSVAGHGQGKGRLADMRKLLWDSKRHCSLFNTRRWVEDLETAYEKAWERWICGIGGDIYL
ncbi:hypothetical protein E4U13_003810 [Claviceps humidiphila]|uniref:protein O-GlcNAc transferase n=1 Tax=Claviceps humidiphila TaxID=1294629 RepID=A0A9P7QB06_9HYPO|nr:hypothetical protein E4U13_003810 [Claviceps humidiphila]